MPCAQCTDPARCDRAGLCQEFRATPGPLLTFSLAYLDGVMEGEPAEVRKHWQRVRASLGVREGAK